MLSSLLIKIISLIFFDLCSSYEFSCLNSQKIYSSQNEFCSFVDWKSARIFDTNKSSEIYFDKIQPISYDFQDETAYQYYNYIKSLNNLPNIPFCTDAIQRFSCVHFFPSCQSSVNTFSTSYFLPCRNQCLQMTSICEKNNIQALDLNFNSPVNINCNNYPITNCMLYLPSGFFAISPDQGDYSYLQYLYIVLAVIWVCYAILWNYYVYVLYKDRCLQICKFMSNVPIIKSITVILALAFWSTCHSWQMCSFWLSVGVINVHLVYETWVLAAFMLIAQGWSITGETLSLPDWRNVLMKMSGFYLFNSIILFMNSLGAKGSLTLILIYAILYGYMYISILHAASIRLFSASKILTFTNSNMPRQMVEPLKEKRLMFSAFFTMMLLLLAAEGITQALGVFDGSIGPVLLCYEIANVVFVGIIGYFFRPRELSPFFFMVPATSENSTSSAVLSIVNAVENAEAQDTLEVAPLISRQTIQITESTDKKSTNVIISQQLKVDGSKMIIVKNLKEEISIGISSSI